MGKASIISGASIALISLCSCSTNEKSYVEWSTIRYLESSEDGGTTSIQGFAAIGPEDSGIYPRKSLDLRKGETCLFVPSSELIEYGVSYGDKVEVEGRVKVSPCREELICITVCEDFLIDVESVNILEDN